MKRILTAGGLALLVTLPASANAYLHRRCGELFTAAGSEAVARHTYRGTRHVSLHDLRRLGYRERCLENPAMQPTVRSYDRHLDRLHQTRLRDAQHQVGPVSTYQLASWYEDGGSTACGFHAGYGVANKSLPCGTKVVVTYHGRSVTATVDDRGPYVGGRVWDLNQTVAGALGFAGVDVVGVSVAG